MNRWLALSMALVACGPEPGVMVEPELDVEGYRDEVHEYVAARCATLDCHGDEGRPLRLYGEFGLRLEADRDAPMSDAEYLANAQSMAGVDGRAFTDLPLDEHLLLTKPLAMDAGGEAHVGETVWVDREARGYICLHAWLEGRASEVSDACAAAREAFRPPPED